MGFYKPHCTACGAEEGQPHHDEDYRHIIVALEEYGESARATAPAVEQLLCQPCFEGRVEMEKSKSMEPLYYILNETDGVFCHPDPMTRGECDDFMIEFRQRFARQGYYLTSEGQRIPVSEVRFRRIPESEAAL